MIYALIWFVGFLCGIAATAQAYRKLAQEPKPTVALRFYEQLGERVYRGSPKADTAFLDDLK